MSDNTEEHPGENAEPITDSGGQERYPVDGNWPDGDIVGLITVAVYDQPLQDGGFTPNVPPFAFSLKTDPGITGEQGILALLTSLMSVQRTLVAGTINELPAAPDQKDSLERLVFEEMDENFAQFHAYIEGVFNRLEEMPAKLVVNTDGRAERTEEPTRTQPDPTPSTEEG